MPQLIEQSIRAQVLLERMKAGEDRRLDAFLRDMDRRLREILTRAEMTAVQRDRIEALVIEVGEAMTTPQDRHAAAFLGRMNDLADAVTDTEARSLAAALKGFDTAAPCANVIRAAVLSAPLSVRGAGGGLLLERFLAKRNEATIERVEGAIRRGFYEGLTTSQIVQDLRGTKAANYPTA